MKRSMRGLAFALMFAAAARAADLMIRVPKKEYLFGTTSSLG